ncbi:MAG: hypothetical protein LC643_01615 [Bacteroidales bacterium]|nr:hypothetical protein [Bacteroidales bacterium]
MKLLRISIYVLIVLAIAKFTSGNRPQMQEATSYSNTLSFRAAPQLEQQSIRHVMNNDSVTYMNFYSDLPLNHKPMYMRTNSETTSMFTRIYQANEQKGRKSDLNFSFIVF